jgi:hypothetical protein
MQEERGSSDDVKKGFVRFEVEQYRKLNFWRKVFDIWSSIVVTELALA